MSVPMEIKVNPETMIIEDSCFKTYGCGSAVASSSYSTEQIKQMNIKDAIRSYSQYPVYDSLNVHKEYDFDTIILLKIPVLILYLISIPKLLVNPLIMGSPILFP